MPSYKIYYVDTFTNKAFTGNPAAVCVTNQPLTEVLMQKIAFELNLSETAFTYCLNKPKNLYNIRWYTPITEVCLCGHATLATAHILFNNSYVNSDCVSFYAQYRDLYLHAQKSSYGIALEFPRDTLQEVPTYLKQRLLNCLKLPSNCPIYQGNLTKQIIIEVNNEQVVQNLQPNFKELLSIAYNLTGVAVTAKSISYDFVSRFFDPWEGINEDPVTGSAHTVLAPYWSKKLNKNSLNAKQISSRGGKLKLQLSKQHVYIAGNSITTLKGEILV
ncbi:PhzF family phenazine biosynthesis protein [Clostridium sp. 'deep sea']|uniref:PhzF family phenazine biosynthesis protein n=1 Tax=Clostridium sp. 'deep sea' TaxID=2779445 RepID=UPI0018968D3E|nr:PhzF family phenazine biosynthesis protein [Clostridium sp. 'deep sea']QOR34061.1 PhzF family phenazine biosynthesis protein [Clostridium sp. 'deep sea']